MSLLESNEVQWLDDEDKPVGEPSSKNVDWREYVNLESGGKFVNYLTYSTQQKSSLQFSV